MYFLQHVDDETYSTLKPVVLNEAEKRDSSLFCEKYKQAVYGTDSVPLKNEVLECKQSSSEDITSYSHRLREKAAVAFTSEESIDENCLLALMRGLRDGEIRRKLNESSVTSFSEALKLAKKLEKISNMFDNELKLTAPILKNSGVSFTAADNKLQEKDPYTVDHTLCRERPRHDSYDSRRPNRSPSPWRDRRWVSKSRERHATSTRPETRRCWACNRVGHLKRNCYARNRASNPFKAQPRRNLN